MRVVFDTNVVVSAPISSLGPSAHLIHAWHEGRFELVISEAILDEINRVLQRTEVTRRFRATDDWRERLLASLRNTSTFVEPAVVDAVPRDPPDNLVLGTAIAAGAAVLVTGNEHLLALGSYRGVAIVTPRQLLDRIDAPPA